MSVCYLSCDESLSLRIQNYPGFSEAEIIEVKLPITASEITIDLLIAGPDTTNLERLTATVSDWNLPPATLCIIAKDVFEQQAELLSHHPRVGRSIFFCEDSPAAVQAGLEQVYTFYTKRASLNIDNSISGNYTTNNISPRWLFQTMMEHLDEYIYFKDGHSKFLAVSRYLAESCGKKEPSDVLGLCDFDLFDHQHAQEAYSDERRIAAGELNELNKEEKIVKNGTFAWVASRKLPLHTRSNYLAGSFGLSRDITEEKELHEKLEKNHERMHAELLLARKLQDTLIQQRIPDFSDRRGRSTLEIATKYIPSFHLSGDFFSVTKPEDGGVAILMADVMGHGVRAAMVTAMIQIAVHQLRDCASQPAVFMTRLNNMMQRTMQPTGETMFATAVYCYIDLDTKQLTYVQAGARHGIHVPTVNSKSAAIFNGGSIRPALGLLPDVQYKEATTVLESGDEILLYTDGIVEAATGDEEYSEARLINFLMEHRRDTLTEMIDELLKSVQEFTHSKDLDDDVCLIALRIP